jgi:glycerol-3-phosphate dehydrogenase
VDQVIDSFGFSVRKSKTKSIPLHGNISEEITAEKDHLFIYGSEKELYLKMEAENQDYKERIHPDYPYTAGQVIWAVRNEMARTVEDFLARRIRLLLLDAKAAMEASEKVAQIMAKELNKDHEWAVDQHNDFIDLAKKYILN